MTTIAKYETGALEQAAIVGDLSKLTADQRLAYYQAVCQSMGLNPLSKPFDYINLNGKLTLYCKKDATDQLRKLHNVSVTITGRDTIDGVHVVTAHASTPDGRADEEIGAVTIANLKGDALANALMKATTKAKRRVTLSICGLGWLDETETETIRDARPVYVNHATGEILDKPAPKTLPAPASPPMTFDDVFEEPAVEQVNAPTEAPVDDTAPPDIIDYLQNEIAIFAAGKSSIPKYNSNHEDICKTAMDRIKALANGHSAAVAEAIIGHPFARWSALTPAEATVLCFWFRTGNEAEARQSVASIKSYLGLS